MAEAKILTEAGTGETRQATPLVRKVILSPPPASLRDNRGDRERLLDELAAAGETVRSLSFHALGELHAALTAGTVTALVSEEGRVLGVEPGDTSGRLYGLAVDIGTTTVVVELVDLRGGSLGRVAGPNLQVRLGDDLLTRIQNAELGAGEELRRLALESLNPLVHKLAAAHGIGAREITSAAVAGNPTMIHMLLGLDPVALSREPYAPVAVAPDILPARAVGLSLHPEAPVFFLPGAGAFVGGDVLGGLLASGLADREELGVLIDVGTNGELIIGNRDWLLAGAGAAGPAFEGGAVKAGMRAEVGAIEELRIDPSTRRVRYRTIGGAPPRGICGSGLIDTLAELFAAGIIDRTGHFREGNSFTVATPEETGGGSIVVDQEDVLTFIRTKAGMTAALDLALGRVGLTPGDIGTFYLAGAIANYLDLEEAVTIGLLPDLPRERFVNIGNGALWGARLCLRYRESREKIEELRRRIYYLELNAETEYMNLFTSALFLPHTDLDRYPSVRARLASRADAG